MKKAFTILAVATFLAVTPSPCFALWDVETVSRERAKELAMTVRSTPAGPSRVQVELAFEAEGELRNFSTVDLHFAKGAKPAAAPGPVVVREDPSQPGRVVASFTSEAAQLDKLALWVRV